MEQFHGVPIRAGVLDDAHLTRFLSRITVCDDRHWIWSGGRDGHGYGMFNRDGKGRGAHRVAYDLFVADLDPDLTIDHLCFVKRCVAPDCLEQVTREENSRRAWHRSQWWRDAMRPGIEVRAAQKVTFDEWKAFAAARDARVPTTAQDAARTLRVQCPESRGEALCSARQQVEGVVSLERFRMGDGHRPNCTRCNATVFMNREHCDRCEAHFEWLPRRAGTPNRPIKRIRKVR